MRRSTLTLTTTAFLFGSTVLAVAISACGGSDPPPPTNPSAQPYGQQPYPPQQYPQQYPPQQQPYPQQTAYPQPTVAPQPPGPGVDPNAGGQMATPGPLALPCSNDGACGFHRCNVPAGKCAFPCQTPVDCAAGNVCTMGVCTPKPPGSP